MPMTSDYIPPGHRNGLALLRRAAGMTINDLAEQIGCHRDSLVRWERGDHLPSLSYIRRLAQVFGVSEDEIAAACQ